MQATAAAYWPIAAAFLKPTAPSEVATIDALLVQANPAGIQKPFVEALTAAAAKYPLPITWKEVDACKPAARRRANRN